MPCRGPIPDRDETGPVVRLDGGNAGAAPPVPRPEPGRLMFAVGGRGARRAAHHTGHLPRAGTGMPGGFGQLAGPFLRTSSTWAIASRSSPSQLSDFSPTSLTHQASASDRDLATPAS